MKEYTIGEIVRDGLLLNNKGLPYLHKASVSKIVNLQDYKLKKTPHGEAKTLTENQIEQLNNRW